MTDDLDREQDEPEAVVPTTPEERPPLELTETALEGLLFVAERPLTLREYARAQSFPDSYRLPDASREDVVRGIGNAVPVLAARDLIQQVRAAA